MRGGYSLRRRLLFWMIATFALGLAASVAFEYLELIDIKAPGALEDVIEVLLLALPFLVVTLLSWLIVGWSIAPLSRASREAELVGPADPAAGFPTTTFRSKSSRWSAPSTVRSIASQAPTRRNGG